MPVHYDDALPLLIRISRAAGIDFASTGTVVLRDATGRLGIVFASRRKSDDLAQKLRDELGIYSLAEPILPSTMFASIKQTNPRELMIAMGNGEFEPIWLSDRRIVGVDWLSDLSPPAGGTPRLVFGSLKGGVGRTTALSVLAADLGKHGKRVLCIDLDIEAPGLGTMLLKNDPQDDRRPNYGVLDYLVESGLRELDDDELFDFIGVSHFSDGFIHVLPAVGRVTDSHPENMIGKLSRGLVESIDENGRKTIVIKLRGMLDRFARSGEYDVILVDARAGLAEITAGSWLGLGATSLLLFGANQQQTFSGYRYVLAHLVQSLGIPDTNEDDWRARITFVQSKAPNTGAGREIFRDRLYELCVETLYDADDEANREWLFNFGFDEQGIGIPHDATLVAYHSDYDAFAPLEEAATLREDIYRGPFGPFLERAWHLLGHEKAE